MFEFNYLELEQELGVDSCFDNKVSFTEGAYSWYTFSNEILRIAPNLNSEAGTYTLDWTNTKTIIGDASCAEAGVTYPNIETGTKTIIIT